MVRNFDSIIIFFCCARNEQLAFPRNRRLTKTCKPSILLLHSRESPRFSPVLVLHTEKTKPLEAFGKSYPLAPYRLRFRGVYLAGLLNGVFFAVLRNARIRKRGDSLHNRLNRGLGLKFAKTVPGADIAKAHGYPLPASISLNAHCAATRVAKYRL